MNAVCAVLAAGASQRLGVPKQLLRVSNATTLVRRAVECACESRCSRVAVIVGAHGNEVVATVSELGVDVIHNRDWQEGIGASIRVAASWAQEVEADALILSVCDKPLLAPAHLDALLGASEDGSRITASFYSERPGVPALFPKPLFAELLELRGDVGPAPILGTAKDVVTIPWPEGVLDVDTPEDARCVTYLL